jgi:hypothetical protein
VIFFREYFQEVLSLGIWETRKWVWVSAPELISQLDRRLDAKRFQVGPGDVGKPWHVIPFCAYPDILERCTPNVPSTFFFLLDFWRDGRCIVCLYFGLPDFGNSSSIKSYSSYIKSHFNILLYNSMITTYEPIKLRWNAKIALD